MREDFVKTMAKRCVPLILLACWLSVAASAWAQDADADADAASPKGERFEVAFDNLWAWMKLTSFPPMVTLGNVNDAVPGALGQPGTRVLLGERNLDHGEFRAGRVSMTYWLNEPRTLSVEGNFFITEQRTFSFNTSSDGSSPSIRFPIRRMPIRAASPASWRAMSISTTRPG